MTSASGPWLHELRALRIETTDDLAVEIRSADRQLLVTVEREGRKAVFVVDLLQPGYIDMEGSGIATDRFRDDDGKPQRELRVSAAIVTEAFDERDDVIIDAYDITVPYDLSTCSVFLLGRVGVPTPETRCRLLSAPSGGSPAGP